MTQEKIIHRILPNGFTFHWNKRKYHVVIFFRDEQADDILYVMKYWSRRQYWVYEVWHAWEYDMKFRKDIFKFGVKYDTD